MADAVVPSVAGAAEAVAVPAVVVVVERRGTATIVVLWSVAIAMVIVAATQLLTWRTAVPRTNGACTRPSAVGCASRR